MAVKRPSTHNPRQRSIQRWENEGGAPKGGSAKRPRISSRIEKQNKAASLASETIDRLADRSATSEEQETRKRRLLKGPKEFRDGHRDQRK